MGIDGTSIYAAATSGSSAIAVHLLACLLARTWSGPEATAIWVELVTERKRDITENMDPSQIQGMAARVAAQQEISRTDLANWDASARAWLLSADEVQRRNLTQLRLIIKDCGLFVSSLGSTYANVLEVWTGAMKTAQDLILGKPQRVSKGALLLGLSAWHIFPDLNVVGPIAHVRFGDNLVDKGGVITLGLQSASPDDDPGVQWSLSLSHFRYYGDPVRVCTKFEPHGSRISMEELNMIVLGIVFGKWGSCITDPLNGAKMLATLVSCLTSQAESGLEKTFPGLHFLWHAAKRLLETPHADRQGALSLMAYGRRRGQNFLMSRTDKVEPVFGMTNPRIAWELTHGGENSPGPTKPTTFEDIEDLRNFATLLGCASENCIIQYYRKSKEDFTPEDLLAPQFEYTTAVPVQRCSTKRESDGNSRPSMYHIKWVPPRSDDLSMPDLEIAQECEMYDLKNVNFSAENPHIIWYEPSELNRSQPGNFAHISKDWDSEKCCRRLFYYHLVGDIRRAALFILEEPMPFRDVQLTKFLDFYGSLSQFPDSDTLHYAHYRRGNIPLKDKERSTARFHLSLNRLAYASALYRQLPEATVSASVVRCPMYDAVCCDTNLIELHAKFASIAMFETGSPNTPMKQLSPVMALCSGNAIYVADALIQDPFQPKLDNNQGITRIIGNIDHPGVVMLAPPQAPMIRGEEPDSWRMVNHHIFDGRAEDCFSETSLHLSFTKFEVPLSVPVGAIDPEVSMVEALVQSYNRKKWVADLDVIACLKHKDYFLPILLPPCVHKGATPSPPLEIAAVQIRKATDKHLVSVDSWEELLDPPEDLGTKNIAVVRAGNSWHARIATMSVSIQRHLRTTVLPTEPLCTLCGVKAFKDIASDVQVLIM